MNWRLSWRVLWWAPIVGLTGVGGGSLMTPILIFGFGIKPYLAIGTDLLFAAFTKGGGVTEPGPRPPGATGGWWASCRRWAAFRPPCCHAVGAAPAGPGQCHRTAPS
jgi:hypothetical protein